MSEQWPTQRVSAAPAWVATAAVPILFVAGLLLTYVIEGVVAGEVPADERSFVADLVGMATTSFLVLVPAARAWRLGQRAERSGNRRGRWPRLLAAALAALAVGSMVASILSNTTQGLYA